MTRTRDPAAEAAATRWTDLANCLDVDPALFFTERGASTEPAKAVCRGCVVREQCLQYALDNGEKHGVWGGKSERERRRIRLARNAPASGGGGMTPPRVLALDLSLTATGIAMPDGTLDTYHPRSSGDARLDDITNEVEMALVCGMAAVDPALFVAMEDLPTHARAAGLVGMVHGAVRVALMRWKVPYLTVPPATLKTYATGRGNAPKPDLRMSLYKRTGQDVADDNQVDAAWLRLLTLDLAGHPELDLPQTHRRALAKLTLPEAVAA